MENEIIPTPQENITPPEIIKPKRKIFLPIIILIIFSLLIGIIFYQQKQIAKLSEQKPIVSNIPTPEPTPIPTESPKSLEAELLPFINPKNDPNVGFEILKNENYSCRYWWLGRNDQL